MNSFVPVSAGDLGSTSSGFVAGVQRHDPAAWARLTALYGPLVYGWARRAGLRTEDAADVTQNVFRAVAVAAHTFGYGRPGATFRGWLWAITRNKLRDFWRRQAGKPVAAGGSDAHEMMLAVPDAEPPEELTATGGSALVRRAVIRVRSEFEPRSWEAFWRVVVDGRKPADVGAELGMSANAVYVARSRVLRRLRDVLSEWPDGSGAAAPTD